MDKNNYTPEQIKDIEDRVNKAVTMLKELKLQCACMPQMTNTGDDIFGIKLFPYLQDLKFSPTISPIQDV